MKRANMKEQTYKRMYIKKKKKQSYHNFSIKHPICIRHRR